MSDADVVLVKPKLEIEDGVGDCNCNGDGQEETIRFFPKKGPETTNAKKAKMAKKANKAEVKKLGNHLSFQDMAVAAIKAAESGDGLSRQGILDYIKVTYNLADDLKLVNKRLKVSLKRGVRRGAFRQVKGSGGSGFYKLGKEKAAVGKPKRTVRQAGSQTQSLSKNDQTTNDKFKVFGESIGVALAQLPLEIANTTISEIENLIQRAQAGTTEKD